MDPPAQAVQPVLVARPGPRVRQEALQEEPEVRQEVRREAEVRREQEVRREAEVRRELEARPALEARRAEPVDRIRSWRVENTL